MRLISASMVLIVAIMCVPLQPHAQANVVNEPSINTPRPVVSRPIHAIPRSDFPATSPASPPAAASTATPVATAVVPPVSLTARAAYAVDVTSDAQLYAENADTPLAPASTTKIVTAIVVMQHASPDAMVTVEQGDTVDGTIYSHMGLMAGDVISVRSLLAGMMLNSAGDAALALSRYVGAQLPGEPTADPRARFVAEMNREASQIGMKNTHFIDPDGRDAPGHVTTAHDLAIAAADLFQYQLLQQLVDTRSATVPVQGPNARNITLYNTNDLLGAPGVHGVKTGTTDNAGQCLVIAIWRGTDRVIAVILGSQDRYADMNALLSYLDSQYRWVRLGRDGDLGSLNAELAAKGYSLAITRTVLLTTAEADQLRYTVTITPSNDKAPFAAQGDVVFLIGSRPLLRLAIYAGDPFKSGG